MAHKVGRREIYPPVPPPLPSSRLNEFRSCRNVRSAQIESFMLRALNFKYKHRRHLSFVILVNSSLCFLFENIASGQSRFLGLNKISSWIVNSIYNL